MKRRNFLTSTLAIGALEAIGKEKLPPKKGFIVGQGEARFGQHTPFKGVNPNDLKISSKDTNGNLSIFEYIGTEKLDQVCIFIFTKMKYFILQRENISFS